MQVQVQLEAHLPPPSWDCTVDGIVRVRSSTSSSFRPSPHDFPPPTGGGIRDGIVRIRSSTNSSFRPSSHDFLPPAQGCTQNACSPRPIEHEQQLPSESTRLPASCRGLCRLRGCTPEISLELSENILVILVILRYDLNSLISREILDKVSYLLRYLKISRIDRDIF